MWTGREEETVLRCFKGAMEAISGRWLYGGVSVQRPFSLVMVGVAPGMWGSVSELVMFVLKLAAVSWR